MKKTILEVLPKGGLRHHELTHAVESKLKGKFDGSIPWYMKGTKLDLEARGIIRARARPEARRVSREALRRRKKRGKGRVVYPALFGPCWCSKRFADEVTTPCSICVLPPLTASIACAERAMACSTLRSGR